jgi:UDP-3-O-[3-hydroxymyristoyl] glucosamine N-acyltransferase
MPIEAAQMRERFAELLSDAMGNPNAAAENILPPREATSASIVFVIDPKLMMEAIASPASVLVVSLKAKAALEAGTLAAGRCILFSKNVKLAMALIKAEYFAVEIPLQKTGTIHPTAIIDPSAKIGSGVSIGAYSVIGQNVIVAEGARIDAAVIIEADCKIGKNCHLMSNLYVGPRTEIGERCILMPNSTVGSEGFGFAHDERGRFFRIPQTGKVVLENDVEVGANCTIDRATFGVTRVGEGTKIDKISHIAHNCDIGKHCVLAGKFAVAGSTKIGNHFVAGGRVTVKDNITIVDGVEVAGLSGVHGPITEPGQYGGFPIQPVKDAMRSSMSLAYLPQIRKDVAKILKHLGFS